MSKQPTEPTPHWESGACRRAVALKLATTEDFFTDDKTSEVPEIAGRWCRHCPIQVECLAYALAHDEEGVWGNTTFAQRKKLKRGITRVHCPGCAATDILEMMDGVEICLSCGLSWRV